MELSKQGQILKVYIGESDELDGEPLYEWLVLKAKEENMAGATVLRGLMGFGANSRIHTANILRLSMDLPIIVEVIDTHDKISKFLSIIDPVIKEGMVIIENTETHIYRSNPDKTN